MTAFPQQMGRATRAYVSAYDRSRVHRSRLYAREARLLVADFNGCAQVGALLGIAEWRVESNSSASIGEGAIEDRAAAIQIRCQFPGEVYIRCNATFSDGSVYSQLFVIEVLDSPWFGDQTVFPSGPVEIITTLPLSITGNLPDGFVNSAVDYQYTVNVTATPGVVSLRSGTIPPGITIDENGHATGTYTTGGSYSFTLQVEDAFGSVATVTDTVNVVGRRWLLGPGGASNNFYLLLSDITNLGAVAPAQVPSWLMSGFTFVSGVNGKLFLHGDTTHNAAVSSDGGATWTQCNHNLFVGAGTQLEIQWNGTHYYSGAGVRSVDGITWAATPNWPVGTMRGFMARPSDGALCASMANAGLFKVFRSTDNSATAWTETFSTNVGDVQRMATDGNRICAWQGAPGGGPARSDNFWATFNQVAPPVTLGVRPFWLGSPDSAWLWASSSGFWERNIVGVSTTNVLTGNVGPQAGNREGKAAGIVGVLKEVSPSVYGVWVSNNYAATFTQAAGTFSASAPNFAAIEFLG